MRTATVDKECARLFFNERAHQVIDNPDWAQLCWVSGKEPRLWTQPDFYADLMTSIQQQLQLSTEHSLLEVGCAAGLMAKGLAPLCNKFIGVDIARTAIDKAKTLHLPNAEFVTADAMHLPYTDGTFDRVVCYDVFTNFDDFAAVEPILREMVRVVRVGGLVMAGSIPDAAREKDYPARVAEVARELERKYGPSRQLVNQEQGWGRRLWQWYLRKFHQIEPRIICFYFAREQFVKFGQENGLQTAIEDIHALNPYAGYRFNAIYTRVKP